MEIQQGQFVEVRGLPWLVVTSIRTISTWKSSERKV